MKSVISRISLLLIICLCLPILAACGQQGETNDDSSLSRGAFGWREILIWSELAAEVESSEVSEDVSGDVTLGDVNGDGAINSIDVLLCAQYIASKNPSTGNTDMEISASGDVNEDGVINAADLILIRQRVVDIDNVSLTSPEADVAVVLANDDVYGWWSTYDYETTDSMQFWRLGDIYYPNSVTLKWVTAEKADYYMVYVSQNSDMSDYECYFVNTNSLSIDNLFVGTKSYWQVDAFCSDKTLRSEIGSFTTADSPRALKIDGVSNTRDIGGMAVAEGYRIKQGMVYRGGKLEDITEAGISYFKNKIGITTDLDLRTPGEGGAGSGSPLGEDINYININGRYYVGGSGIHTDEGKALMAQEIKVFADADNYPIYIHCSLGRDRTGTLAFMIEALLGADKNTLIMDYDMSVFSVTGTLDNASYSGNLRTSILDTYNYLNDNFEGEDFSEKVENYLLSTGVTAEEIQSIRDNLLEEVK